MLNRELLLLSISVLVLHWSFFFGTRNLAEDQHVRGATEPKKAQIDRPNDDDIDDDVIPVIDLKKRSLEESLKKLNASKMLRAIGISNATDEFVRELSRVTSLVDLELRGGGVTDCSLKYLKELRNLRHLSLVETGIKGKGLKHLGNLVELRSLKITDGAIESGDFGFLRKLRKLEQFYLADAQFDDQDLANLSSCDKLVSLALWDTQVTNAGLESLRPLPKLRNLILAGNRITDEGEHKLRKMFPQADILRKSDAIRRLEAERKKGPRKKNRKGDRHEWH